MKKKILSLILCLSLTGGSCLLGMEDFSLSGKKRKFPGNKKSHKKRAVEPARKKRKLEDKVKIYPAIVNLSIYLKFPFLASVLENGLIFGQKKIKEVNIPDLLDSLKKSFKTELSLDEQDMMFMNLDQLCCAATRWQDDEDKNEKLVQRLEEFDEGGKNKKFIALVFLIDRLNIPDLTTPLFMKIAKDYFSGKNVLYFNNLPDTIRDEIERTKNNPHHWYYFAKEILKKRNRQTIFNKMPENPVKMCMRLLAKTDQLRLDTNNIDINDIDLSRVKQKIEEAKTSNWLNLRHFKTFSDAIIALLPELLPNLKWLDFADNRLSSFPENFVNFTQLRMLDLSDNRLSSLPGTIVILTHLRGLFLSNNQLTGLPENFGNFTQLRMLDLSNNRLTGFPENFANLTNLRRLDLRNTGLTPNDLPENLQEKHQRNELDIRF